MPKGLRLVRGSESKRPEMPETAEVIPKAACTCWASSEAVCKGQHLDARRAAGLPRRPTSKAYPKGLPQRRSAAGQ